MATIDERLEALTRNLELLEHLVHDLQHLVHDGFRSLYDSTDNLLKIAKIHEERLDRLEEE